MKENIYSIILNNQIIFENDRLITLFSEKRGRFNVIAKYAARSLKRFAGRIHPFNIIQAEINFKTKLAKLEDCHLETHFPHIHQNYNCLLLLGYLKKIIVLGTQEHQENTPLYYSLKNTLSHLNANTHDFLKIKEEFEIEFLINEGLWNKNSNKNSEIKKKLEDYCQKKIPNPQWI